MGLILTCNPGGLLVFGGSDIRMQGNLHCKLCRALSIEYALLNVLFNCRFPRLTGACKRLRFKLKNDPAGSRPVFVLLPPNMRYEPMNRDRATRLAAATCWSTLVVSRIVTRSSFRLLPIVTYKQALDIRYNSEVSLYTLCSTCRVEVTF